MNYSDVAKVLNVLFYNPTTSSFFTRIELSEAQKDPKNEDLRVTLEKFLNEESEYVADALGRVSMSDKDSDDSYSLTSYGYDSTGEYIYILDPVLANSSVFRRKLATDSKGNKYFMHMNYCTGKRERVMMKHFS